MFSILGNGILEGWNLTNGDNISVVVSAGSGHVNYVSVKSKISYIINYLNPNSRNYIYASLTANSYSQQEVVFYSLTSADNTGKLVYLGYVDTNNTTVTNINTENRNNIGYITQIQTLIAQHQHIGGTLNPDPIDLSSQIQGELNSDNIEGLDASKITSGVLSVSNIPVLDHITKLINNGTLTHSQLDTFVNSLTFPNASLMGDISTANLLKSILALKRTHSNIDEDFINEIALIPGISPNLYIDTINSTASWDTVDGTIYASPDGTALRFFTKSFNVGNALKNFIIAYEGEIQYGATSSESSNSSFIESFGDMSVSFAVSAKDSVNINDYQYIDPNKIEDISGLVSDGSIKVMIEFNGDKGDVIIMKGFAFMFSSEGNPIILS